MVKTAVFVSGGGTNLQALLDARAAGKLPHCDLTLVLSTKPGVFALTRAERAGIPTVVIERKKFASKADFAEALLQVTRAHGLELILLAGFLSILDKRFTDQYPNRILNVHPSLIPAFCGDGYYGLRVHEAVLERGCKVTGATVHIVNEITDGGRILLQKSVDVRPEDTAQSLQRRVMEQAEHVLLPRAAEMLAKEITEERGAQP